MNTNSSTIFTLGLSESIDCSATTDTNALYHMVGMNTGNLAFHHAINQLIGKSPRSIPWSSPAEIVDSTGQVGILPCANQLGSHADMGAFADTLSRVKCSLVAVGIGAQSSSSLDEFPELPAGTLRWIEQITEHAKSNRPNITVRGDFTLRVLEHYGFHGKALALGCPSLLINKSPVLGAKLSERYRQPFRKVAIAAGHTDHISLGRLESSLVRIMESTQGSYITQATDEFIALSRGDLSYVSEDYKNHLRAYLGLSVEGEQLDDWIRQYFICFFNIPAWIEYLRRFDLVIGTRIHGVMLAIQAGVPGLCIAYDSRIREICEKSLIPYVMANEVSDGFTLQDVKSMINFNGAEFDKNRAKLHSAYRDFFTSNGVPVTPPNLRS